MKRYKTILHIFYYIQLNDCIVIVLYLCPSANIWNTPFITQLKLWNTFHPLRSNTSTPSLFKCNLSPSIFLLLKDSPILFLLSFPSNFSTFMDHYQQAYIKPFFECREIHLYKTFMTAL